MLNTENYEYPQYSNEDCEYAHLNLDTKDTLTEHDVPDGVVDKVNSGLTGVDHETIGELHGFGAGSTKLARYDDLTTLRTRLHDEAKDTVASPGGCYISLYRMAIKSAAYLRTARPPRSL